MKWGTSKVRAEGCAGLGRAWREQFVQREGTHGMLGGLRTVLTVWMEDGVQWGGNRLEGEEHAEIDRDHIVQDLRIPWQEFGVCSQSIRQTL